MKQLESKAHIIDLMNGVYQILEELNTKDIKYLEVKVNDKEDRVFTLSSELMNDIINVMKSRLETRIKELEISYMNLKKVVAKEE